MFLVYLLFFGVSFAQAKLQGPVEVLPSPQSYEDFEHQNKGCPENSACDEVMGLQLTRWKKLLHSIKNSKDSEEKKAQLLDEFRNKYGIPVDFYTTIKSQQGFKPLYFNSPCSHHNFKDDSKKILKGTAFLKGLSSKSATIWRDQAQMEVPTEELLKAQHVRVYSNDGPEDYYLPLNDQPLYLAGKHLFVLREDDDVFYTLRISQEGEWKIVPTEFSKLSSREERRDNAKCPDEKTSDEIFKIEFCKSVYDESLDKSFIMRMHQGCAI
jgi:hypothetical protein